jgi:hypothetical protein
MSLPETDVVVQYEYLIFIVKISKVHQNVHCLMPLAVLNDLKVMLRDVVGCMLVPKPFCDVPDCCTIAWSVEAVLCPFCWWCQ